MKQVLINPTPSEQIARDHGRIKTLRLAIDKHQARGNTQKVADLQEALDKCMARFDAMVAEIKGS